MRVRVRIGDIFQVPLSDGRKAFGQYVYDDKQTGGLVWIFDLIIRNEIATDELLSKLQEAGVLLGPVFTGLRAALRTGLWRVIGHLPVKGFSYPGFLMGSYEGDRIIGPWRLWDGEKTIPLGARLPEQYRHLEMLSVWSPADVAERVETGENRDRKMIEKGLEL